MKSISYYRTLFPHLENGNIYLNHAAIGPFSRKVIDRINQHLSQRSSGSIDVFPKDLEVIQSCRSRLSRLIHASSPDRIAFAPNTSEALNIVASGLNWKKGDRVLLNDIEFPANVYPYANLKSEGVEIDFVKHKNGKITPEMIEKALTPRTRVVALSAVQFLSGYKANLQAIGEICKRNNVFFVVDGIQAVGAMDINVEDMHIDALASGAHKWQMAPQGIGFLYLTEELQNHIHQKSLGWLSVAEPWQLFNYDQELIDSAQRYEPGTYNIPGIYGYDAALELLEEVGLNNIEERLHKLTQYIIDTIKENENFEIFTSTESSERAGIVTINLPQTINADYLLTYLKEQGIIVAVRSGKVRISPHFYNTEEEIDQIISILNTYLMKYG